MEHKIGIIGGSSAFATSFLLQKINEYSVYIHKSKNDNDFLHTVTVSTPFTHLDFKGNSQKDTLKHLLDNLHELEDIKCNVIIMACNTLHEYWEKLNSLKKNESTILLNLPQIVTSFVDVKEKRIGVLCSERCRQLDLYKPFLEMNNQKIIYPDMSIQQTINYCINSVIINDTSKQYKQLMDISLYKLFEQDVDSIILGCTELSLLKPPKINKTIYDSVELLAIFLNQHFKKQNENL